MRRPSADGLLAGFHLDRPCAEVPEIVALGDQWAPLGRPMGWHAHAEWEIYVQVAGTTTRRSERLVAEMRPGDAFISAPGARHRVDHRGSARQHNRFVRCDLAPVLRRHPAWAPRWTARGCVHLPGATALEAALRELVREASLDQAFRGDGVRGALDAAVLEATRLLGRGAARALVPPPEPVRVAKALIDGACAQPWTLRGLAARARVSPSHLLALFTAHLGAPPHRYLLGVRLERARHLLAHTDAPITAIALELGFGSSQHFARVFRRATGGTAGAARRALRGTSRGRADRG